MNIKRAWLFFEQSGVFKNEFRKLGIPAYDFDIKNNFWETDFRIDLFKEIKDEANGEETVFSEMTVDDLIFAFFPCTRFSARVPLNARGEGAQMKNLSIKEKLSYSAETVKEIAENYEVLCLLVEICLQRNLRLVIENPYTQPHFLTMYFPVKPAFIDTDRRRRGDFYKKPTQYFFINCKPEHNFIFVSGSPAETKRIETTTGDGKHSQAEMRSMMSPAYANRFIREFLLDTREPAVAE